MDSKNQLKKPIFTLEDKNNIVISNSSDPNFINQVHGWSNLSREDDGIDALAQTIEFCSKFI